MVMMVVMMMVVMMMVVMTMITLPAQHYLLIHQKL